MTNTEEFVPNELLRHERSLKGWSQAELAEQVGTSFEIVSRWERGITVPSPYYRERLCAVLGKSAEELGFLRSHTAVINPLPSPLVFLASSHKDAEKPIISHLKTTLQEQGITLWSSRQLGRQQNGHARIALREAVQAAQIIVVILSPEAVSSRHIREAMDMASRYERPVCGIWIEGEHWERCLPEGNIDLAALIDAREKDTPALLEETTKALEQVRLASQNGTEAAQSSIPDTPTEAVIPVNQATQFVTSQSRIVEVSSTPPRPLESTKTVKPMTSNRMGFSRTRAGLLIGLTIVVIAGGILGSLSLLAHFGVLGAGNGPTTLTPVRGGSWTDDFFYEPDSFIPGASTGVPDTMADQALYLPIFYGDAQGVIHPGAASEVPTVQNGGISADAKTWTFHLHHRLKWSDGQTLNARDVDFSWKLWTNPKFPAASTIGFNLITSTTLSPDNLSITFHLKQAFSPFLSIWMDGGTAPLPAHVFSSIAPNKILTSPDNLNPSVTSGPFKMSESVPGDHYTLVRNPNYYLASEGLPYLDKVVIRIAPPDTDTVLKDMQAGTIDSAWNLDPSKVQEFQRYTHYTLNTNATIGSYEAMYFNFHNVVLATHLEVRMAIAMAIDQQALITTALHGFGEPLCTDHGSAYHPGYQPNAECPELNPAAANHLLDDYGWVRGPDGVRAKNGQRLEFEYSTTANNTWRNEYELIIQRNLNAIGIRLDIQNYPPVTFFGSFLPGGKASPPTGAEAGRYDIAELSNNFGCDPDDSSSFACNQIPMVGFNIDFYCNPALEALYKQEQATADPGLRQQIFDQIHSIYLTEFPFIVLNGEKDLAIVRKGTHNYLPGPLGASETINIWQWWCDNGKC